MTSRRLRVDTVTLAVQPGDQLIDLADDHAGLGIPVSCRAAHCGSCLVRIRAGHAGVVAAGADERETLAQLGQPQARLGCQLAFTGRSDVELEVLGLVEHG